MQRLQCTLVGGAVVDASPLRAGCHHERLVVFRSKNELYKEA